MAIKRGVYWLKSTADDKAKVMTLAVASFAEDVRCVFARSRLAAAAAAVRGDAGEEATILNLSRRLADLFEKWL